MNGLKHTLDTLLKYWPLVLVIGSFCLWAYKHDAALARASDLVVVKQSLTQMEQKFEQEMKLRDQQIQDIRKTTRAENVQERIWSLEERYPDPRSMPVSVREEYKKLKVELQKLRAQGY